MSFFDAIADRLRMTRAAPLILFPAFLFGSCGLLPHARITQIPADLKAGAPARRVAGKLGLPDQKQDLLSRMAPYQSMGELWIYKDLWWEGRRMGSWNLYFDSQRRLVAWQLGDSASAQQDDRSALYYLNSRSSGKTEKIAR